MLAVVGPTASGKTGLGIELALTLGGEVISADSMQIYRGMRIATARPTEEEMRGIPHHLIGFVDPQAVSYTHLSWAFPVKRGKNFSRRLL